MAAVGGDIGRAVGDLFGSILEPITGAREKTDEARKQQKAQLKMQADAEAQMAEQKKVLAEEKKNKRVRAVATAAGQADQSQARSSTALGGSYSSGNVKTLLGQ
jgi:hypothetical protein